MTLSYLMVVIIGVLVAAVGTAVHRQWAPFILIACLLAVFCAATMVRAWLGMLGLAVFGGVWLIVVQVLSQVGPGGDVLMPGQPLSYAWAFGGVVAVGVAAFTPRNWFKDRVQGPTQP